MLFALIGVSAFAQKDLRTLSQENAQSPSTTFKCIDRSGLPASKAPKDEFQELVIPLASAQVEKWYTADGKYLLNSPYGLQNFTTVMSTINVAIDGSDIYLQGVSYFFKEGWIKGTISGNKVLFPNGQYVGQDESGPIYFCGAFDTETLIENLEFKYNATEGVLESVTPYLLENSNPTTPDPYAYWFMPVFTKAEPDNSKTVVIPEGLVSDDWVITYDNNMDVP